MPVNTVRPFDGRDTTLQIRLDKKGESSNGATSSTAAEALPNTPPRQAISAPNGGLGAHNLRRLVNRAIDKENIKGRVKEFKEARMLYAKMQGIIGLYEKSFNAAAKEVGSDEKAVKEHEDLIKDLKNEAEKLNLKDEFEEYKAKLVTSNNNGEGKINAPSNPHDKVLSEVGESSNTAKSSADENPVMSGGDLRRKAATAVKNIHLDKETKGKGKTESHSNIPDGIQSNSGSDKNEEMGKAEIPSTPKKEFESKSDDDKKEDGLNKFNHHPGFERIQSVIREELGKAESKREKMTLESAAIEAMEMENTLSSMRQKLYMHMLERISRAIDSMHKIG